MTAEKTLVRFLWACLAFALAYRLHPILASPEVLSQFFITEDGYLLLTVARNLAIGNGLSVSAGEIATNGVQPLVTLIFALPYWLTGGDRLAGLAWVVGLSALFASGAAILVHRFARAALRPQTGAAVWPLLVATLWFTGPLALLHSMNALETGLYVLMATAALCLYGHLTATRERWGWSERILLGAMLGLVFLTRNDAAFLIFAILATRLVHLLASGRAGIAAALAEVVPAGLVSIAVASPWLAYNLVAFGSVVPISGQAQMGSVVGGNLPLVPVMLFETMLPMLPVPGGLQLSPPVIALSAAVVFGVLAVFLWTTMRRGGPFRAVIAAYAVYGLLLVGYYGLFFGAPHFLSRYFAPLAPLLVTAAVSVGLDAAAWLGAAWRGRAPALAGGAAAALSVALLARLLVPGVHSQGHFHVVDWVRENVPGETWVGAIQTGTLGYWHDRTINLDGKVNPQALRARLDEGTVLGYVVGSEIDVLADWAGIAVWAEMTDHGFDRIFELGFVDHGRNMAVLRRRADDPS